MSGLVVRADRPRRPVLLGLVGCLLTSCGVSAPEAPPPDPPGVSATATASASARQVAAQKTLDAVASAVRSQDRATFLHQLAPSDSASASPATTLYRLAALPLVSLSLRLRPRRNGLPRARQDLLGPDAFVQQVAVDWRLSGDVGPAQHLIWLTFVSGEGALRLAGTGDGPVAQGSQPLWLIEPVTAETHGPALVLSGAGRGEAWLRAGAEAVATLRRSLRSSQGAHWNGRLVFELPATREAFDRVLGVVPGSYAQIAAVAWPEGADPATSAVRIVVNPGLATGLDEQSLGILVTHEATHVATRSAASAAPTWLVEGFADYQAYEAYPRGATPAAATLLAHVKAAGPPRSLPADASFSPDARDLELTYAKSWLACRYLGRTYSPMSLNRFYRVVDQGADVDHALRSVFGVTTRTFTARWAASLQPAAQRRT